MKAENRGAFSGMPRCVIVGGAPIDNYERISGVLRDTDFMIYCDCGLRHEKKLGRKPGIIVGDFDSYSRDNIRSDAEIIELNPVKDDTDTSHAVTAALSRGFEDFLLIGVTGRRVDHTLSNIYLLYRLFMLGKTAVISDDFSDISIIGSDPVQLDDSYPYFSLINITGKAEGITVKNAKFPLENAKIVQTANDLGVSNEVLPGKTAIVSVREGCLLLVRDITG